MLVVGTAAALTQMLNPKVMRMIDQSSTFRTHPELRARRTGEYIVTITYGDTETATQAAASLRAIHARLKALDPQTGEEYGVLVPEYLLWVHQTLTWCTVRGSRAFGAELSATQCDQYVREQRIAAELAGCDLDQVSTSFVELEEWVLDQLPFLAFTSEAVWFRDLMVPRGVKFGTKAVVNQLLARAAVGIMSDEHRELYGLRWPSWQDAAYHSSVSLLFRSIRSKLPVERAIPGIRTELDVKAFGARNSVIPQTPTPATDPSLPAPGVDS
jgi:uncharacterized protein (DUF2236 family)